MSTWRRYHLDETLAALAIPDGRRFFVCLREPPGETRRPVEFYRWKLDDARRAADKLVQAYYPHDCDASACGDWKQTES
ncbi:MAG TPA: hypothetical protein VFX96_16930 [Pyrinomonadaceae bacterium]|nr:hypothetical protein [Pyrinomonadaceae bacterium]